MPGIITPTPTSALAPQPAEVKPVKEYRQIFSATGLPSGMTISEDGLLAGTPHESGEFNFTVRMIDSDGLDITLDATLVVNPPTGVLEIIRADVAPATVGVAHSVQFSAQKKA